MSPSYFDIATDRGVCNPDVCEAGAAFEGRDIAEACCPLDLNLQVRLRVGGRSGVV